MLLELSKIVKDDGGSLQFRFQESLEMLADCLGTLSFDGPVVLEGELRNFNGLLMLKAKAEVNVRNSCSRCGAPVAELLAVEIVEDIVEQKSDSGNPEDEERYVWSGNSLSLDKIVGEALLLQAPVYGLCSEDCKGVCQHCGTNLNTGTCACGDRKPVDIRMAALEGFFDGSERD